MTLTAQDMLAESLSAPSVCARATLMHHSGEPLHSWWGATSPANVMVWLLWEAGIDSRRIAGVYADMLRLVQPFYEDATRGDCAVRWCIGELQSWADGDGARFKLAAAGEAAASRARYLWPQSYRECAATAAWCACSGVTRGYGDGMIVEHLKGSCRNGISNDTLAAIITDHVSSQDLEAAWIRSHHGRLELGPVNATALDDEGWYG